MKFKKLIAIALLGLSFVWLAACGNKDVLGTTFTFNYANSGRSTRNRIVFVLLLKMVMSITLTQVT